MKRTILLTIDDLAIDFVVYGRRDDEELPLGSIEKAIEDGIISLDEIVARFKSAVESRLS